MEIVKDALLSDCKKFRYTLKRTWDADLARVLYLMLNPSKADAKIDDKTITRCIGFAQRMPGIGGFTVANLFAYRSKDPEDLLKAEDPIGPRNNKILKDLLFDAQIVVCAWGSHGSQINALIARQLHMLQYSLKCRELWCLGTTKEGAPRHPLFLKNETELEPFGIQL
jgi:hypothetical protein